MKRSLTQEERKLIVRMAAAQMLGAIKTDNSRKTKRIKRYIIDALELFGITQADMYDIQDVHYKAYDEAFKAGNALMYRGWRK